MALGKKAKQTKTQYENENQALGRAAYPKIQPTLDRIGDLTMNPDQYRKDILNDYYNSENSARWSDAQRNALRTLANATANNYSATHGGYSSAGNKYYDDTTRAVNDYNARLWDVGVNSANDMYNKDLTNTQSYYKTLLGQHDLAQRPDAIDTYNQVIDKANKNAWTGIANTAGSVIGSIPTPVTRAIGAGLQLAGNIGSTDYSDTLSRLGAEISPSTLGNREQYINPATNLGTIASDITSHYKGQGDWDRLKNWYSNKRGGIAEGTVEGALNKDDPMANDVIMTASGPVYIHNPNKPTLRG